MIEAVVRTVMTQGRPSSGDDLHGFSIDADHFWAEGGTLVDVDVRRTGRPDCLIEVRATVADHVQSLQEVASALLGPWLSTAYSGFQATSCVCYREATVLRFVTAIPATFFVTGRVIVGGGPQDKLVEHCVRDFGALENSPPTWG